MKKIANFTKQSIRNGAVVLGGHRVKYVSDDKEFIILATKFGDYVGVYITYENDGAYYDSDRTEENGANKTFSTFDECKKYWKVDEYAEGTEDKKLVKSEVATKDVELSPMMKQFHDLKSKHPEAILLFRCGDFYEVYEDDAKIVANKVGITLTKRTSSPKGEGFMACFPFHALDTYLPKLIRAGFRVAICDQLEDPKLAKKLVKRGITELVSPSAEEEPKTETVAKEIKMEVADATVKELALNTCVSSQIEMRKIVTEACNKDNISLDHVSIWQHNGNGDYGLAVAFDGKKPVAVAQWERTRTDRGTNYIFVTDKADKYAVLRNRI